VDRRVRKGLKARRVPWGRRVRRVRRAIQEIPVDPQGRRVRKGWMVRKDHRDRKAPPVQKGHKVQPDLKEIRADLQGRKARKEWTAPEDRRALQVRWEKSAPWT